MNLLQRNRVRKTCSLYMKEKKISFLPLWMWIPKWTPDELKPNCEIWNYKVHKRRCRGQCIYNLGEENDFLNEASIAQIIKHKMDESNYIKSKGFLVHERHYRQRLKKDERRSYWQFQNQQGIRGIFKKVLQIERRQPQ